MGNKNTFTKIIVTGLVFAVISMGGCSFAINYYDNLAMKAMVANGSDPIDARCAIKGSANNACAIRAATKNKK